MKNLSQNKIINIFFASMISLVILVFSFKILTKPDIIINHVQERWLIENLNEVIIQTPYGYKTYRYLKNSMVIIEQEKDIYEQEKIIKLRVIKIK